MNITVYRQRPGHGQKDLLPTTVTPEQIVNPICRCRLGKKMLFEWRAHLDDDGKRSEIIGYSHSLMVTPTKWWPIFENEPCFRARTPSEFRQEMIMATRGAMFEKGIDPDHQSAIAALITLLEIVKQDADSLACEWFQQAVRATEIERFMSEWDNLDQDAARLRSKLPPDSVLVIARA